MSLDMPSQGEFEQLVSEKLREESWTFEEAEQILFTIQLYKLLDTLTLEPSTTLDDNVLALTLKESTALLEKGLQNQKLHDISSRSFSVPMEYIASAATGLTAATSPVIAPALTMISPFSPLALAAIPFLIKKKSKHQKNTKQVALAPSNVAAYAKLHGRWLVNEKKPVSEKPLTPSAPLKYSPATYDQELMAMSENLIESARKKSSKSNSTQAKNAQGARPNIQYAKVQAAYCALLNLRNECICISPKLENIVLDEIRETVLMKHPEITEESLKKYIKSAVNLAMKTDDADDGAITRIVRLKGHWNNKWLKIKCKMSEHQS